MKFFEDHIWLDGYLNRKYLSPLGQRGEQCVWVTGGMFPSSSISSSSSSLWPQQDTSSEIMGLCPWLISSFMTHVWALHLYSTCCYDRHVKVGSGELTRHKSTTTSRTEALLSRFFCPPEALWTPLYWRTRWATCMWSIITPLFSGLVLQQEVIAI